jgi:arylsulfatase A-like enzyme
VFSIRKGDWKLIDGPGSGGWSYPRDNKNTKMPKVQLYNMKQDVEESMNVEADKAEKVKELKAELEKIKKDGYSRKM